MADRQLSFPLVSAEVDEHRLHRAARYLGTMPWRLEYTIGGRHGEYRDAVVAEVGLATVPTPEAWARIIKLLWHDLDAGVHDLGRSMCQSCGRPILLGDAAEVRGRRVAVDVWRHPDGHWEITSASASHLAFSVVPEHKRDKPLFRDHGLTCEARTRVAHRTRR